VTQVQSSMKLTNHFSSRINSKNGSKHKREYASRKLNNYFIDINHTYIFIISICDNQNV